MNLLIKFAEGSVEKLKLAALYGLLTVEWVRKRLRPREPRVLRRTEGRVPSGSKDMLCVFAHYDRDGVVDDYVVCYLSKLHAIGCEIVFVTTARDLADAEIEKVRPYCSRILERENFGHDFGSWKAGMESVSDLKAYDRVIIANDSVYGPILPLEPVIEKMIASGADFWGITDSPRYTHHLQSYFVAFERRVVESAAFAKFWQSYPHYRHKNLVVLIGEVGLSRTLTRAGFRFAALCPWKDVRRAYQRRHQTSSSELAWKFNSSHWFWDILIAEFGCPFIKVQLLRDNPKEVPNVDRWVDLVSQAADYDAGLIGNHLSRFREAGGASRTTISP